MCKDWDELAAQIRALREQIAKVTAERDALQRQLELADALRNHERGIRPRSADSTIGTAVQHPQAADPHVTYVDHGPLVSKRKD